MIAEMAGSVLLPGPRSRQLCHLDQGARPFPHVWTAYLAAIVPSDRVGGYNQALVTVPAGEGLFGESLRREDLGGCFGRSRLSTTRPRASVRCGHSSTVPATGRSSRLSFGLPLEAKSVPRPTLEPSLTCSWAPSISGSCSTAGAVDDAQIALLVASTLGANAAPG